MALMITDECISCGVCLPECPNEAIVEDNGVFRIRGGRCTECAGFFDEPKCRELCPVPRAQKAGGGGDEGDGLVTFVRRGCERRSFPAPFLCR